MSSDLLGTIDKFLAETGMGPTYFGRVACGNSELVSRLRKGGRIWPETEANVRAFIIAERRRRQRDERLESAAR